MVFLKTPCLFRTERLTTFPGQLSIAQENEVVVMLLFPIVIFIFFLCAIYDEFFFLVRKPVLTKNLCKIKMVTLIVVSGHVKISMLVCGWLC